MKSKLFSLVATPRRLSLTLRPHFLQLLPSSRLLALSHLTVNFVHAVPPTCSTFPPTSLPGNCPPLFEDPAQSMCPLVYFPFRQLAPWRQGLSFPVSAPGLVWAYSKHKDLLWEGLEEEGFAYAINYSLHVYLLSTYYVPGTVLSAGGRMVKKVFPGPMEHIF